MQGLFSDFKPSTAAEWKSQLTKDLKGEPYESLIWLNENGFEIKPFYTSEDLESAYEPAFTHAHWEVCVHGRSEDPKVLNTQLLRQLNSGATSVSINCTGLDLETALKGIELNYIQSVFFADVKSAIELKACLEKNHKAEEISCSVFPGHFSSMQDLEKWSEVISAFKTFPNVNTISVDVLHFHNQNCFAYYEAALVLAQLVEYLEYHASGGAKIPDFKLAVRAGVSSDYFIQIAKLRAIRRLWRLLREEYKIQNELHVIVETSLSNKSISDSYNNLLRTTVEAMAAILGGCNELVVTGFDVLFPQNETLAERMAINQQLILKEESYFDKMADVACGSFYIESITDAIAKKALETFKRFEKEGGYFKCLEKGIFSAEITAQAKVREVLVNTQKQVVIGVNKFKNEKEKISLSESHIKALKGKEINNPVLDFELQHYFHLKNA